MECFRFFGALLWRHFSLLFNSDFPRADIFPFFFLLSLHINFIVAKKLPGKIATIFANVVIKLGQKNIIIMIINSRENERENGGEKPNRNKMAFFQVVS